MGDLVRYNEEYQKPMVDSRLVAKVLGVEHKAVKQLLREYEKDFAGFGEVAFKKEPSEAGQNE